MRYFENPSWIPGYWCPADLLIPVATMSWASYQIHKIAGAHAPGMPGTFSPSPQVSDPGMHHGTCVTHVPWCMPGSLTSGFLWNRRRGKTFPAFPAHAQPAILHIWKEAHWPDNICWPCGISFRAYRVPPLRRKLLNRCLLSFFPLETGVTCTWMSILTPVEQHFINSYHLL